MRSGEVGDRRRTAIVRVSPIDLEALRLEVCQTVVRCYEGHSLHLRILEVGDSR